MIGVRSPDTDGHSVFDLNSLRELHSDPSDEGQYAHALRGLGDDGWEGNQAVVDGTRQIIIDRMEEANTTIRQAPGKQLTTGTIYLDFYGRVSVPVYAPIFLVGQAAHALQDSFAHTLRTEDYRQILHAMNYVDAIGGSHDEDRDGMAHSDSMDDCTTGGRERVEAAIEATVDLLIAARERFSDKDPNAVVHVLDKWLTLQPAEECTLANAYCNANMLAHARVKQTAPYLEGIFGCESLTMTARPQERDAGVALTLLLAFAMMLRSGYTRTKAPALGQSTVRRSSH